MTAPSCPRCQEDRLITRVETAKRVVYVCEVCTQEWPEREQATDVNGAVIDGP